MLVCVVLVLVMFIAIALDHDFHYSQCMPDYQVPKYCLMLGPTNNSPSMLCAGILASLYKSDQLATLILSLTQMIIKIS